MKKFTKLFLSCAAMAAVTAAVATSAMAAKLDKVEYVAGDTADSAKITLPAEFTDTTKTLLILEKGVTLEQAAANPSTATILQIGQDAYATDADSETAGTQIVVPIAKKNAEADADKGSYAVYMGGDQGVVYEGSFRLGGSDQLVGDVDNNEIFNAEDASAIFKHVAKITTLTDADAIEAADANDNGVINAEDASTVLKHVAKIDTTVLGTKTVSDKTNHVE